MADLYRVVGFKRTDGTHEAGGLRPLHEAMRIFFRVVAEVGFTGHSADGVKVMAEREYERIYGGAL